MKSRITVPIKAQEKVIGALFLARYELGKVFSENDLNLLKEIASRCGHTAYLLMQYSNAKKDTEKLRIEMDVSNQFISHTRNDALSVLTDVQLVAQLIQLTKAPVNFPCL
jgi:GAF domain-containing protein